MLKLAHVWTNLITCLHHNLDFGSTTYTAHPPELKWCISFGCVWLPKVKVESEGEKKVETLGPPLSHFHRLYQKKEASHISQKVGPLESWEIFLLFCKWCGTVVPNFAPSRAPHFPNFIYFLRTKHTCWNVARKSAKNWKVSSLSILCCLANERRGNYLENEDRYINKMARGAFIFFWRKSKESGRAHLFFIF